MNTRPPVVDDRVCLFTGFGGLGDNLMFSTLPERFAEIGKDFYIYKKNPFRNNEIKELVWDMNPYVKGYDTSPNIGFQRTGNPYIPKADNQIKSVEIHHGFEPKNEYGKIYYEPKELSDLEDKVIIDCSVITRSRDYPPSIRNKLIELAQKKHKSSDIVLLGYDESISSQNTDYDLKVDSIYHLCDIITSCAHYISLHSGGNYLACSLVKDTKMTELTCFIGEGTFNMLWHNGNQALFQNCTYVTVGKNGTV
ncbi:MAG: hypothetical protein VW683_01325 [Betaproteobacteria bacterium]|jgi:hypothetical protein